MIATTPDPRRPRNLRRVVATGPSTAAVNERDLPGPVSPPQNDRQPPPVPGEIIEPFMEPQHESAASAREVPLETDVAPDLLDREAPTDEDLH